MKEMSTMIIAILLSVLLFHITITGIVNAREVQRLHSNIEILRVDIKKSEKKIMYLEQSISKSIINKEVPCNKLKK